jgi:hypothetical protein
MAQAVECLPISIEFKPCYHQKKKKLSRKEFIGRVSAFSINKFRELYLSRNKEMQSVGKILLEELFV